MVIRKLKVSANLYEVRITSVAQTRTFCMTSTAVSFAFTPGLSLGNTTVKSPLSMLFGHNTHFSTMSSSTSSFSDRSLTRHMRYASSGRLNSCRHASSGASLSKPRAWTACSKASMSIVIGHLYILTCCRMRSVCLSIAGVERGSVRRATRERRQDIHSRRIGMPYILTE